MWSEVDESRRKGGGAPSGDEKEDAGPGLLTLPPLKERLPDVPKPPTKGTAERGRSRGRDGGARPM